MGATPIFPSASDRKIARGTRQSDAKGERLAAAPEERATQVAPTRAGEPSTNFLDANVAKRRETRLKKPAPRLAICGWGRSHRPCSASRAGNPSQSDGSEASKT